MGKEKNKPAIVESDSNKQEPYCGSTVIVWIRPKPGKFCELNINIGDAKKSIMVPSSFFQELMEALSMVSEKIEEANKIFCKPDEG